MPPARRDTNTTILPVRLAVCIAHDTDLAALNRRQFRRGSGRFRPARDLIPMIEAADPTRVPPALLLTWAQHPDERVPIAAARRGLLIAGAAVAALVRAVRGASREGVCWTPLLDALRTDMDQNELPVGFFTQWQGLLTRMRRCLTATKGERAMTRAAVRELLRFQHPCVSRLVAEHAPSLSATQVRRLTRRRCETAMVYAPRRAAPRERAALATWAVETLAAAERAGVVSDADLYRRAGTILWALHWRGVRIPVHLAAPLARVLRYPVSGAPQLRFPEDFERMVQDAVLNATREELRVLEKHAKAVLLRDRSAAVRLAVLAAVGRSSRGTGAVSPAGLQAP